MGSPPRPAPRAFKANETLFTTRKSFLSRFLRSWVRASAAPPFEKGRQDHEGEDGRQGCAFGRSPVIREPFRAQFSRYRVRAKKDARNQAKEKGHECEHRHKGWA